MKITNRNAVMMYDADDDVDVAVKQTTHCNINRSDAKNIRFKIDNRHCRCFSALIFSSLTFLLHVNRFVCSNIRRKEILNRLQFNERKHCQCEANADVKLEKALLSLCLC